MHYSELSLDVPLEEAASVVSRSVSDLRRTEDDGTVTFKTNSGVTVATLTDASTTSASGRTRLKYRTTMISPSMASARTKARQVRDALQAYE